MGPQQYKIHVYIYTYIYNREILDFYPIMDMSSCLQPPLEIGIRRNHMRSKRFRGSKTRGKLCLLGTNLSSASLGNCTWSRNHSRRIQRRVRTVPSRNRQIRCYCFLNAGSSLDPASVKNATSTLARTFNHLLGSPRLIKLASAAGVVVFAIWGLGPLVRRCRNIFLRKSDSNWKKSSIYHDLASYIQPLLLWTGTLFICRQLDPVVLPLEAGQIVKLRVINFVRSLSTVLAFGQCLSSVIQQMQKFFMETNDQTDTRNMGFQFASRALYTAVWVAAVSLFMELLGFSTQKWMTAGGLGTVLLTLAGREILTNFLSSVMIHATRPFVLNEWIQTNVEGYEVSGTVEHVGWWSPTIIRGDDREAIHIPNHKFTVNIVRNLSQKTHWRIKTHLAISHSDVGKVNNIVADMRKVLAKNPQVEQQKLHRRVFLDDINPENQALMILVSCFVKTSHFEEYLCVKEAIILDLIRVVTHHRARLATPIRTVQKISTDADLDPFSDSVYAHGAASNHPFLLIEPSYKINGDDRTKTQVHSVHLYGDEDSKATLRSTQSTPDDADDAKVGEELGEKVETKDTKSLSDLKLGNSTTISNTDNSTARQSEAQEGTASTSNLKQDLNPPVAQPPVTKPSLEENIVLGVALDGSKRTLPIDEEDMVLVPPPNSEDMRELAALHGSNGTLVEDKSDSKWTNSPGFVGGDQLDQQA